MTPLGNIRRGDPLPLSEAISSYRDWLEEALTGRKGFVIQLPGKREGKSDKPLSSTLLFKGNV